MLTVGQRILPVVRTILSETPALRTMATRADRMKQTLESDLEASHVELINESYMHNVPKDSETHFKVVVVSSQFNGTSLISRHRKVQECLKAELQTGLHALSIIAKTPGEWSKEQGPIEPSPNCRGGFGK